ncbi:sn-glycerol-3-phosphate ABC transporter ATP-binding protein UgpC [Mesorhizobium sp. M6A.T.Cr.TU.017.01.1.1]|uniref:ABC transporter ATP-binding protein n=1 Tax=Mesorhizobium sp. M6A.T.Cr.TU.017.01.1.1 TaxID=2496774 RepID=UPI000FD57DA6|nr:sn-glycerol-3-phosphate ABC transporter ATP-binding protein UgpC [Mesorhizobium sp. M6A.T.Cr.TU.017.01.1.1]RUU97424.1 sn-glycerol-3-phosphate ABC transporter ATP-binding protein UgpC [Mesorhizobium sp. M6A.T.Cr.TU.017.01.1.1]
MAGLSLQSVRKRFGETEVIGGVDLDVADGEFVVFVGPSGCGKSTLLRMIAGLERTSDGRILIGGRDVTDEDPAKRGIAMVFQTYALYPHMTVATNMGFPLEMAKRPKEEIDRKVAEAAKILHLEAYLGRKPRELSGGQRQRVAIGRAIVRQPGVFLFDEPLSNLDAELRVQMRIEIARLHQELGTTMIYVTHDQIEAMTLASRIVVLRAGRIEQVGAPLELYENPDNSFVAGFIGSPRMNFVPATVMAVEDGRAVVTAPEAGLVGMAVATRGAPPKLGTSVSLGIRPEHFVPAKGASGALSGKISLVERLGGVTYGHALLASGSMITVESRDTDRFEIGKTEIFGFQRAFLFGADGVRL